LGLAEETGVWLQLPERLRNLKPPTAPAPDKRLHCCSWIKGAWVSGNGDLQPCCMLSDVADMGNTADGPLHENEHYNQVKSLLAEGKVFRQCIDKTMCSFVQQEKAAGRQFKMIKEAKQCRPNENPAAGVVPTQLTISG
jgi:hypothetical protein